MHEAKAIVLKEQSLFRLQQVILGRLSVLCSFSLMLEHRALGDLKYLLGIHIEPYFKEIRVIRPFVPQVRD